MSHDINRRKSPETGSRILLPRRRLLISTAGLAAASAAWPSPALAATRLLTPRQTEGPFYPDRMPVDRDADLLQVAGRQLYTRGRAAIVEGLVLNRDGRPLPGVLVEIWQCDVGGHYRHSGDRGTPDPDFQGYGRVITGADGAYRFRTIRPAPYPGRTPHIHFKLSSGGRHLLTTQLYVAGEPLNRRDGILRWMSEAERQAVTSRFEPLPEAAARQAGAQLRARFDLTVAAG